MLQVQYLDLLWKGPKIIQMQETLINLHYLGTCPHPFEPCSLGQQRAALGCPLSTGKLWLDIMEAAKCSQIFNLKTVFFKTKIIEKECGVHKPSHTSYETLVEALMIFRQILSLVKGDKIMKNHMHHEVPCGFQGLNLGLVIGAPPLNPPCITRRNASKAFPIDLARDATPKSLL